MHVEAAARPDLASAETNWLHEVAHRSGFPTAIVPFIDLLADDAFARVEALSEMERVVGVRQILNWDADDPKWCFAPDDILKTRRAQEVLAHLASVGLRFEAQVWHQQFADLARLADKTGLRIAINHCGMPRARDPEYLSRWSDALAVFAGNPSVVMKFSGMTMFDRHWSAQSARPVFDRLFDVFGPDRLMFGSNFPVDRIGSSYRNCVERSAELADGAGAHFSRNFFLHNAARFYELAS